MILKRNIDKQLKEWKESDINNPMSKPLIVEGPRQVGKTTSIQNFFKSNNIDYVYIDLFANNVLHETIKNKNIDLLVDSLKKYFNLNDAYPFVFFDEAQACIEIIELLKYFRQDYPEIRVIVSGSLLSLKLNDNQTKIMFPTGKVNQIEMSPMNFEEFMINLYPGLNDKIVDSISLANLSIFNHMYFETLKNAYYEYLIIGGMPQSVVSYIESIQNNATNKISLSQEITVQLIENYKRDIFYHFGANKDKDKALSIFNVIHKQMNKENKRFFLNEISTTNNVDSKNNKFRDFKYVFWKLLSSRMVNFIFYLSELKIPLNNFVEESRFKAYYSDVAFYTNLYDLNLNQIYSNHENWTFIKGGVAENFVNNELRYNNNKWLISNNIFTYSKNNKEINLELDFILENLNIKNTVIEVKSSTNIKSKSFKTIRKTFDNWNYIMCSLNKLEIKDNTIYLPIFLIGYFYKYVINSNDKQIYDKYNLKY